MPRLSRGRGCGSERVLSSIPHAELMLCVARRVSDKAMLHLVKQWLVAPVEETDEGVRV